ncbi:MAG: Cof-type HAD-IIB family hydrolase [Propionibacteriaceae bacterium]|nr:Cof-type HAD-IIB family hydrolase [Propionibacteriaceae bacterium]
MTRRIAFVDVDGTLMGEWGVISPIARAALAAARRAGHLVYICTGRTEVELAGLLGDVEYDGVVAACGGSIHIDGQPVWQSHFTPAALAAVLARSAAVGLTYYAETAQALVPSPTALAELDKLVSAYLAADRPPAARRSLEAFLTWFQPGPLPRDDVYKVSFLGGHGLTVEALQTAFAGVANVVISTVKLFGPNCGELLQPGVNKASAMAWVLDHLGFDRRDSLAIGDSANDLEMLDYAGVGIAMGNATPEVQAAADEVTASVDEEGLAAAFQRHGLIAA